MNQYLITKQQYEDAKKELSDKNAEFAPLYQSIKAVNSQIAALETQIADAPQKLASGELSTEDFLKIKSELAVLKESLSAFNEAREIQQDALVPFHGSVNRLAELIHRQEQEMIANLPTRLIADFFSSESKQQIKTLLNAVVATDKRAYNALNGRYSTDSTVFFENLGRMFFKVCGGINLQDAKIKSKELALNFLTTEEV